MQRRRGRRGGRAIHAIADFRLAGLELGIGQEGRAIARGAVGEDEMKRVVAGVVAMRKPGRIADNVLDYSQFALLTCLCKAA